MTRDLEQNSPLRADYGAVHAAASTADSLEEPSTARPAASRRSRLAWAAPPAIIAATLLMVAYRTRRDVSLAPAPSPWAGDLAARSKPTFELFGSHGDGSKHLERVHETRAIRARDPLGVDDAGDNDDNDSMSRNDDDHFDDQPHGGNDDDNVQDDDGDHGVDKAPTQTPGTETIVVGAIGASVTWGVCSTDPYTKSWPALLQNKLDARWGKGKFKILNFGAPGTTIQSGYTESYTSTEVYRLAKASGADIFTLLLGSDDADIDIVWDEANFKKAYKDMIGELAALPSEPHILPVIPPPYHHIQGDNGTTFKGSVYEVAELLNQELPSLIPQIASEAGLDLVVDLFRQFGGAHDASTPKHESETNYAWYCPNVAFGDLHPNNNGYEHIANVMIPFIEHLAGVIYRPHETTGGDGFDDEHDLDDPKTNMNGRDDDDNNMTKVKAHRIAPEKGDDDNTPSGGSGLTNDDIPDGVGQVKARGGKDDDCRGINCDD